jgi:hypothetical protein
MSAYGHNREVSAPNWLVDWSFVSIKGNTAPPRDPDDDEAEDEEGDDEPDDPDPAVIREPDE